MSVLLGHRGLTTHPIASNSSSTSSCTASSLLESGLDIQDVEDFIRARDPQGLTDFLEKTEAEALGELVLNNPQTFVSALKSNNADIGNHERIKTIIKVTYS